MRVADRVHLERDWRIHGVVPDFRLEDVWELPEVQGVAGDFDRAVALATAGDPGHARGPAGLLWRVRDLLGRWLDLGGISDPADPAHGALPIPGCSETSLRARLPHDLRGTAARVRFEHLPFVPLYRTDDELAAEISNRTVHGVLHLAWRPIGDGRFQGQMAVYVKPRGRFGRAYMAVIKPFRYWIVYPALERRIARDWVNGDAGRAGHAAAPAPRPGSARR